MSIPLAVALAYLGVLICLALWSRRETHSMSGFFLAGKKMPYWVVAFSTNATGESGWLLLGLTGMGYAVGAQALWVVVGEVLGIWLAWTLVARRFKRLSDRSDAITVPDVLAARFNDTRHILRSVSIVIILVMVGAYVTAQMVASGKALSSFIAIDYGPAVIVGGVVIIAYTLVGGFKAVAYTDVVQGVLMLAGLIVVPLVAINAAGGFEGLATSLAAIDPNLLNPWGTGGPAGWIAIISFLAIGLPFLGVPQLMTRFMSASSEHELGKARVISVSVILLFDLGAVAAGMAGRALFPDLADAETIFPILAQELFPAVITGLLMVIVLAAIMSTVDSLLLLASSAVVRDLMQTVLRSGKSDAQLTAVGKVITVVVGVVGIALALYEAPLIFWFVLFAWSGLGAAFGPVILCALFDPKANLTGAVAGMVSGFATSVIWVLALKAHTFGLYEMIPGFLVGLVVTLGFSRLAGPPVQENRG